MSPSTLSCGFIALTTIPGYLMAHFDSHDSQVERDLEMITQGIDNLMSDGCMALKGEIASESTYNPNLVPPELQKLWKSRLCRRFDSTGRCYLGRNCSFAHGKEELLRPLCNNLTKCEVPKCTYRHYIAKKHSYTPGCEPREMDCGIELILYNKIEFLGEEELEDDEAEKVPMLWADAMEIEDEVEKIESISSMDIEKCIIMEGMDMHKRLFIPPEMQRTWKSRLCRHFMTKGRCERGRDCGFAHGERELLRPLCYSFPKCDDPWCTYRHKIVQKSIY